MEVQTDSAPPVIGPPPLPVPAPKRDSADWRDFLLALPFIWGFDLLMGVALGVAMLTAGAPGLEGISPFMILATTLLSGVFCAAVTWFFVCKRHRKGFVEGFVLQHPGLKVLLGSVGLGIIAAAAGAWLFAQFSTGESMMAKLASTAEGFVTVAILAVVVPPLEEIYYRGFVFPVLEKLIGARWGLLVVGLWFGLMHGMQLAGD